MKDSCDVLVVGTGIAGLSFALYLTEQNPDLDIVLLSKGDLPESNTWLAQGGIAAVTDSNDTFSSHIRDTMLAGGGLSDTSVVEKVVHEAPARITDLLRWGVSFDQSETGYHLHREGGHSAHRILHHKDFTGREIHQKLFQQVTEKESIFIRTHCFAIDLYVVQNQCRGLYYYCDLQQQKILMTAKVVMLATGGSGQMFLFTTNSSGATGDGVAMAARAGAKIKDMGYYQFHPTALYDPGRHPTCLISEAVRGFGAYVINRDGRRFLFDHDQRGELATRDVVTRAIFAEMEATNTSHVFLSVKHLDVNEFARRFPSIFQQCVSLGLDVSKDDIPVLPAAHYQCGGIKVDEIGRSSIDRLYAGGECACTGLHGANRLASNSLLEALVFARRSADEVCREIHKFALPEYEDIEPSWFFTNKEVTPEILTLVSQVREMLQRLVNEAFHHKNDVQILQSCLEKISFWKTHFGRPDHIFQQASGELRNLLENAWLLVTALVTDADAKETCGSHMSCSKKLPDMDSGLNSHR